MERIRIHDSFKRSNYLTIRQLAKATGLKETVIRKKLLELKIIEKRVTQYLLTNKALSQGIGKFGKKQVGTNFSYAYNLFEVSKIEMWLNKNTS